MQEGMVVPMKSREMKQYGWITGPVECCCTGCDWSVNFVAVDSSIPVHIAKDFASHNCADYTPPSHITAQRVEITVQRVALGA